jgi:glutamate synthase (NADPH/NADH) large chain
VVVLGACGRNFAAGMSGGLAYVFDERGDFAEKRCNPSSVDLEPLVDFQEVQMVRDLITRHCELTGSRRARWILDNWAEVLPRFIKIFPHEYKRVLGVGRPAPAKVPDPIPVSVLAEQVQHG